MDKSTKLTDEEKNLIESQDSHDEPDVEEAKTDE